MTGTTSESGDLVIWVPGDNPDLTWTTTPTGGTDDPTDTGETPGDLRTVPGGAYLVIPVTGDYEVTVSPDPGG